MSGSEPLTIRDIDTLALAFKSPRDQAAFLLSCGCGLRAGTLCALKISHVLDRNHRLTGRVEIPRIAMKGKRAAHSVEIPKRALNALGIWIAQHPAPHRAAPLWPSERNQEEGITTRQWQRLFAAACQAADIGGRRTPHSARKFFAHAIFEGTDKDIQLTTRALGNKNPMSTMHYLDFGQRRIDAATLDIFSRAAEPQLSFTAPDQNISSTQ